MAEWRFAQPLMNGNDLKVMGFKPGPLFRDILNTLKVAHLEGNIETKEQELRLVMDKYKHHMQ
jgi:tRNA nucleotidyltransferase (CCA-adding enzyme)